MTFDVTDIFLIVVWCILGLYDLFKSSKITKADYLFVWLVGLCALIEAYILK